MSTFYKRFRIIEDPGIYSYVKENATNDSSSRRKKRHYLELLPVDKLFKREMLFYSVTDLSKKRSKQWCRYLSISFTLQQTETGSSRLSQPATNLKISVKIWHKCGQVQTCSWFFRVKLWDVRTPNSSHSCICFVFKSRKNLHESLVTRRHQGKTWSVGKYSCRMRDLYEYIAWSTR